MVIFTARITEGGRIPFWLGAAYWDGLRSEMVCVLRPFHRFVPALRAWWWRPPYSRAQKNYVEERENAAYWRGRCDERRRHAVSLDEARLEGFKNCKLWYEVTDRSPKDGDDS